MPPQHANIRMPHKQPHKHATIMRFDPARWPHHVPADSGAAADVRAEACLPSLCAGSCQPLACSSRLFLPLADGAAAGVRAEARAVVLHPPAAWAADRRRTRAGRAGHAERLRRVPGCAWQQRSGCWLPFAAIQACVLRFACLDNHHGPCLTALIITRLKAPVVTAALQTTTWMGQPALSLSPAMPLTASMHLRRSADYDLDGAAGVGSAGGLALARHLLQVRSCYWGGVGGPLLAGWEGCCLLSATCCSCGGERLWSRSSCVWDGLLSRGCCSVNQTGTVACAPAQHLA